MKRKLAEAALIVSLLSPFRALCAPPTGYGLEFRPVPRTVSGVYTVDSSGMLYYGHYDAKHAPKSLEQGERGMSNELWVYDPTSDTHQLFNRAADHASPRINSASGIAVDESVDPRRYWIADQSPNGDPWTSGAIWLGEDLNADGDINDPGETSLATDINAIPSVEGVILDESSGVLYASDATGSAGSIMIYRLEDQNGDDFFQAPEITSYFNLPIDSFAGKLAFDTTDPTVIFTVDSAGRLYRLKDLNADLDCNDPLEATILTSALNGGFGVAVDPAGRVFVTGSNYVSGTHHLYRITPGAPTPVEVFDDLAGFTGWSGTVIFDRGTDFEPNHTSARLYMNYSTPLWSDPDVFAIYSGTTPDVPALNSIGIVIAIGVLGILIVTRKH